MPSCIQKAENLSEKMHLPPSATLTYVCFASDIDYFPQVFRDCLRQLLQGKALSTEDLVDILTLKDNKTSIEDYSTGIHLLLSTTVGCGIFYLSVSFVDCQT
jgi:hypothetical protein